MKLYEIAAEEQIQLMARKEDTSVNYSTTVAFVKNKVLFLRPVIHDGCIVNFTSKNVIVNAVYINSDSKPYIWKNCAINNIDYEGERYHIIYSDNEGIKLNRREAYRQYIGVKGELQTEQTHMSREVLVKDISTTGVSFVTEPSVSWKDIGGFHLRYNDEECNLSVNVSGKIIRDTDIDDSKRVFGGVISKSNVDLNSYVTQKQKNELAKKHLR